MKKTIIYFFAFLMIFFFIPALLTKKDVKTSAVQNEQTQTEVVNNTSNTNIEYNYNKYGTIKLLHKKTNTVEEVALDDYLCNVVSAEMPADFEEEALKAQAVAARSYVLKKIEQNHNRLK